MSQPRSLCRRAACRLGIAIVLASGLGWGAAQAATCPAWPLWESFRQTYVTPDGRVQDLDLPQRPTVSEGQAYAMFFALVAGDRPTFNALLRWTRDNLAKGDLSRHLPAWHWGRSAAGRWEVLDANSASDADLWMAYSLLEAGRLWQNDAHQRLGRSLAARLMQESTAELPGLGRSLLPGPKGFRVAAQQWRLNPSYVPLPLLQRLADATADPQWSGLIEPTLRLLVESAPRGISPDWVIWDEAAGWRADSATQAVGSYNAIRTYLWAGMSRADPHFEPLALALLPWLHWVGLRGHAPESLDTRQAPNADATYTATREGPVGFDAAAMVFAESLGLSGLQARLRSRVEAGFTEKSPGYYSHALALFGLGWTEKRFRFSPEGALVLPAPACNARSR